MGLLIFTLAALAGVAVGVAVTMVIHVAFASASLNSGDPMDAVQYYAGAGVIACLVGLIGCYPSRDHSVRFVGGIVLGFGSRLDFLL